MNDAFDLRDLIPSKKQMGSIKFLRNCFRRDIIGDRRSPTFSLFWRAVKAYAPDVDISLDTPTSSRNTTELQPAFDLVCRLLGDTPSSMAVFLSNGSSPESTPVPMLMETVAAFLDCPVARSASSGVPVCDISRALM
jgi:hypothetical protein